MTFFLKQSVLSAKWTLYSGLIYNNCQNYLNNFTAALLKVKILSNFMATNEKQ